MDKMIMQQLKRLEQSLAGKEELVGRERMRAEVVLVKQALAELRAGVLERDFGSVAAEVYFFKEVKPRFHSLLILATERYHYELGRPLLGGKVLERYAKRQLDFIGHFFAQHKLLYEYYRLGASDLDERLFVRANVSDDFSFVGLPEIYPVFSTYGEYLFSKFMAMEKLREEILSFMLRSEVGVGEVVRSRKGRELRWTGDTVNLIELVYGLFDTKQLNDGQVDLSDIMEVFEQVFQVNLSRYFRRFSEIKRRKTVSKTKYLDSMVEAVNRRIDEGDAYVPAAMR